MKRFTLVLIASVLLILAVPAGVALAAPEDGSGHPFEKIVTGGDFTLEEGEVESGDVVIFGGSAEIEEGALVEGDLMIFGGSAEIDGDIEGSVIVLGGSVDISDSAYVGGDFAVIGGSASVDEGATIEGDVATNPDWNSFPFGRGSDGDDDWDWDEPTPPQIPEIPDVPEVRTPREVDVVHISRPSFAGRVGSAFLSALGMGVLAFLIGLFLPKQVEQTRKVLLREPVMSGAVGFLTFMAAGLLTPILAVISGILVLICIGILGFPIILLMWLAIGLACLFGWAVLGRLAGQWLQKRFGLQGLTPVAEVALGAFSLSLALGIVEAMPFVGWTGGIAHFIVLCFGLGAVVLTRFGQRDYHRGQPILPQRKPKPGAPAEVVIDEPAEIEPQEEDAAPEEESESESRFDEPELDEEGPFPEK